jgi:molybdopterin-containing oxidoreductase family membrane subunit
MQYLLFGLHGHNMMVPWMWSALILMSVGAIFLLIPKLRNNHALLPVTCAMIFFGAWIDKALGMIAGGFVPSPLHHVKEYAPTLQEGIIALGVYGTGFFVLTILYKLATTVKEEVRG